jgi:Gas vesicle protein K
VKKKSKTRSQKPARRRTPRTRASNPRRIRPTSDVAAVPVTAADLRALRQELERRIRTKGAVSVGKQRTRAMRPGGPLRWNPEPEDVQKSVAQLVLTIVEFLRRLMERQAIRRMEQKTLTRKQVEAVGAALMTLEETIREMGRRFGLEPEDLNLDLGPIGKLM